MEEREEEERDDDGNGEDRESTTKCILEESTTIGNSGRHDDFPSNECNINPKPQFYTANRVLVVGC